MRSAEWREDGGAQTDVSLQSVSDCLSTPEKIAHASHEYGGVQPSGAVASGAPNHAALQLKFHSKARRSVSKPHSRRPKSSKPIKDL